MDSSSTQSKHNTPEISSRRPSGDSPIIGASALLELAEWIAVRRQSAEQGGSSCAEPSSVSPPAPTRTHNARFSGSALDDAARRESATHVDHAQSGRGPEVDERTTKIGGDA